MYSLSKYTKKNVEPLMCILSISFKNNWVSFLIQSNLQFKLIQFD